MNATAILDFLRPGPGEPLQSTFLVLIVGLALLTMLMVEAGAQPPRWQANWEGRVAGSLGQQLDVDHGSVSDLCQAVATRWERIAEFMPGTLLIIGLLGTFIALGLSLNEASTLLAHHGTGSAAAPNSEDLNHLFKTLDGLGSKFKTSTWGILGYLLLRLWASAKGHEEQRLQWSIGKMKTELEARRLVHGRLTDDRHLELLKAFALLANYGRTTAEATAKTCVLTEAYVSGNDKTLQGLREAAKVMSEAAGSIDLSAGLLSRSAGTLGSTVSDFGNQVSTVLGEVKRELSTAIGGFTEATSSGMERIARDMRDATTGIASAVQLMQGALERNLAQIGASLDRSITLLNQSQKETGDGVRQVLGQLRESLTTAQTQMQAAMRLQVDAQREFMATSSELSREINQTRIGIDMAFKEIKAALKHVSESHLAVRNLDHRYSTVGDMAKEHSHAIAHLVDALARLETRLAAMPSPPATRTSTLPPARPSKTRLKNRTPRRGDADPEGA